MRFQNQMYTTSTVISGDQKEEVLKKSVNPFSKRVAIRLTMLTFDLCQRTTLFQYEGEQGGMQDFKFWASYCSKHDARSPKC